MNVALAHNYDYNTNEETDHGRDAESGGRNEKASKGVLCYEGRDGTTEVEGTGKAVRRNGSCLFGQGTD